MYTTLETSHCSSGLLKELQYENISLMSVTLETSQQPMGSLKRLQPLNKPHISFTREVFHFSMPEKSVRRMVFHSPLEFSNPPKSPRHICDVGCINIPQMHSVISNELLQLFLGAWRVCCHWCFSLKVKKNALAAKKGAQKKTAWFGNQAATTKKMKKTGKNKKPKTAFKTLQSVQNKGFTPPPPNA